MVADMAAQQHPAAGTAGMLGYAPSLLPHIRFLLPHTKADSFATVYLSQNGRMACSGRKGAQHSGSADRRIQPSFHRRQPGQVSGARVRWAAQRWLVGGTLAAGWQLCQGMGRLHGTTT